MTEREAFEAWHAENKNNDWLWRVNKVDAYHVWQASRRAALEEATEACVAEQVEVDVSFNPLPDEAYNRACSHCADAIRALAESARSEGT